MAAVCTHTYQKEKKNVKYDDCFFLALSCGTLNL